MKIITDISEMQQLARAFNRADNVLALVPTMGALHAGHLSLVKKAKEKADCVIVSLFVNPTQFGPTEDLSRYPRPFEADVALAKEQGVDILFAPTASEFYHVDHSTWVDVEGVTSVNEGARRAGHFRGVSTIVTKLFNATLPHYAVFGQKDAQQVSVIRRMVRDLNIPVELLIGEIIRESDGVALSSRNIYLTPAERTAAAKIFAALKRAERLFANGETDAATLIAMITGELTLPGLMKTDYVSVADWHSMTELSAVVSGALLSVAVKMEESGTRLLDNMVF